MVRLLILDLSYDTLYLYVIDVVCTVYKTTLGTFGKTVILLCSGKHSVIVQSDYEGMYLFVSLLFPLIYLVPRT